jgi:hypothetical protein
MFYLELQSWKDDSYLTTGKTPFLLREKYGIKYGKFPVGYKQKR